MSDLNSSTLELDHEWFMNWLFLSWPVWRHQVHVHHIVKETDMNHGIMSSLCLSFNMI